MLVIGVGNDYRQDDALGLLLVRELAKMHFPDVRIVESRGEGTELFNYVATEQEVILIDAVTSGVAPGTIQRFNALVAPLPTGFLCHSTHAFSVAQAIELARQLQRLPRFLIVYGIEGDKFGYSDELSPSLAKMITQIIEQMVDHLRAEMLRAEMLRAEMLLPVYLKLAHLPEK